MRDKTAGVSVGVSPTYCRPLPHLSSCHVFCLLLLKRVPLLVCMPYLFQEEEEEEEEEAVMRGVNTNEEEEEEGEE